MLGERRRIGKGDRFEVVSRLGTGGMGTVLDVLDRESGSRVALKAVGNVEGDALLRFKREFRALQDFNHPNIIGYGELFENGGEWFYTMDLIEGVSFLQYVRTLPLVQASDAGEAARAAADEPTRTPPPMDHPPRSAAPVSPREPPPHERASESDDELLTSAPPARSSQPAPQPPGFAEDRLRSALAQLAAGLHAVHAAGKVHRDIKPSNILVTTEGRAVMLDFGLVTDVHDGQQVTDVGAYGTYPYMSPEQASGLPLDARSDMYSVGVVLFQALTGQLPFPGKGVGALMAKLHADAPDPTRLTAGLPADLVLLCNELLARAPTDRPTAAQVLERAGAHGLSDPVSSAAHPSGAHAIPFVGRTLELAALRDALARSEEGGLVGVLVKGQSGIGKTELIDRFERELRQARPSVVVLRGRCFAREAVPFKSFDAIMDGLSGHLARMTLDEQRRMIPRHDELLARAFPVLKRVELFTDPRRERDPVRDPQEQRGRVFTAIRTLFAKFAALTPVVLVLEDVQWLDDDSRALIGELLRQPAPPPLLFIATLRVDDHAAGPESKVALGEVAFRTITLAPLSEDESLELARSLLGTRDADATRVTAIARESRGHPLFIDELARHSASAGEGDVVSPQLEDAIRARVADLGEDAALLLEVLAVVAGPLPLDILARATHLGIERVMRVCTLCRAQRLVRMSGVRRTDTVELYHGRIVEALRHALAPEAIAAAHQWVARALEVERSPDTLGLATHWAGAGESEKAARFAMRAAEEANETLAFDRAAALYRLSLQLAPEDADGLAERRERLAHALANAGRGEEAGESYLLAVASASEAKAIDLRRRAAEQFLLSGHVKRGIESFKPLLEVLRLRYPDTMLGVVLAILWVRTRLLLRAWRYTERDASMVPPIERLRADTAHSAAVGLVATDTLRGFDYYGRALLVALQLGEPGRLAVELAMEAGQLVAQNGRRRRKSHVLLEKARALAGRSGQPEARGAVHYSEGMSAYLLGEWQRAVEGFERAERLYRSECAQAPAELRTIQASFVQCLWEQGRWATLQDRTARVLKESEERGDLFTEATIRAGLNMQVQCMLDRAEQGYLGARQVVEHWSGEGFDVQRYMFWVHSAFARSYMGDADGALAEFRASMPRAKRSLLFHVQLMRAGAFQAHALLALRVAVQKPHPEMKLLLRDARREARRLFREDAPWAKATGALIRGCASAIEGESVDAIWWLDAAVQRYDAVGMSGRAAAARWARGIVRGGDEGAREVAVARAHFVGEGVVDPERFAATLAPSVAAGLARA